MFSSGSFKKRSLIHLDLIFIQGDRCESNLTPACGHPGCPAHLLKMLSFLQGIFFPLCQISDVCNCEPPDVGAGI